VQICALLFSSGTQRKVEKLKGRKSKGKIQKADNQTTEKSKGRQINRQKNQ